MNYAPAAGEVEMRNQQNTRRYQILIFALLIPNLMLIVFYTNPKLPNLELILSIANIFSILLLIYVLISPKLTTSIDTYSDPETLKLDVKYGVKSYFEPFNEIQLLTIFVYTSIFLVLIYEGMILTSQFLKIAEKPFSLITIPLITLIMGILFSRFRIWTENDVIRGSLGIWFPKFKPEDIESVEIIKIQALRDFGGYGIRFGKNKTIGYITGTPYGLRIQRKSGRNYVLSTNYPDLLLQSLVNTKRNNEQTESNSSGK